MFPHVTFSTTEVGATHLGFPGLASLSPIRTQYLGAVGFPPTMAASGTPSHPKRGGRFGNLGKVWFEPRRKLSSPGFLVFGLLASMEWHLHRGNLWRARQWGGGWKIPKIPNPPQKKSPAFPKRSTQLLMP